MVQYGSRVDEKWLYCEEERNTDRFKVDYHRCSLFQTFRWWEAVRSKGSDTSPPPSFLFFRAPFYFVPLPTI